MKIGLTRILAKMMMMMMMMRGMMRGMMIIILGTRIAYTEHRIST